MLLQLMYHWDRLHLRNHNMKRIITILALLSLTGCATIQKAGYEENPKSVGTKLQSEFDTIPAPAGRPVTVAVYSFKDQTGQRRNIPNIASFSTAVTQGAEPFLIRALQEVGHGQWFDVVERVSVDNLVKERTIIKQMRDAYEGQNAKPLMPLQFAGVLIEGGIIGYDSSTESGGAAYKWLGIGPQTQYSKDVVTISLRAVSVGTGKVLATVTESKTIYSSSDSIAVLKFFKGGTQSFEFETGLTINEPTSLAVKTTIEAAVVELIKEGQRKGVWDYRSNVPVIVPEVPKQPVTPAEPEVVTKPVAQEEPIEAKAVEEPKAEQEPVKQEIKKPEAKKKNNKPKPMVDNGPKVSKEQVDVKLH